MSCGHHCPRCGHCLEDWGECSYCGLVLQDDDQEELFDADELGLDPEDDDRRLYGCQ